MITMHQRLAASTRTSNKPGFYEAETVIDGKRYSAQSRYGAPFALARVLVTAGVADQPVQVTHSGLRGHVSYRSLYRMATLTIQESTTTSVRLGRYQEPPNFRDVFAKQGGEAPSEVPDTAPTPSRDISTVRTEPGSPAASTADGGC
jgi:hypothetical protein